LFSVRLEVLIVGNPCIRLRVCIRPSGHPPADAPQRAEAGLSDSGQLDEDSLADRIKTETCLKVRNFHGSQLLVCSTQPLPGGSAVGFGAQEPLSINRVGGTERFGCRAVALFASGRICGRGGEPISFGSELGLFGRKPEEFLGCLLELTCGVLAGHCRPRKARLGVASLTLALGLLCCEAVPPGA